MRIILLSAVFLFLFANNLGAQPEPCVDPEMTPRCVDACVICDIDGFSGRNFDRNGGEAPRDFCTTFVHNISWIAFVAGTPNLTLDVTVSNCQIGWGLEIGIYESLDCDRNGDMRRVSNCNTDARQGTHRFTNTVPLTVGQYYFFVMDGSGDDVCNYEVNVVEGSTAIGELEEITFIDGEISTCPGDTVNYEVPSRIGTTFQQWFLDGTIIQEQDTAVQIIFEDSGTYNLCYSAFNVCDTLPPICKTISVQELPVIVTRDTLCENECFYYEPFDTLICQPGRNVFFSQNEKGCTEEFWVEIEYLPTPTSNLELEFCFGDTVKIGNESYFETGDYQATLTSKKGCDSIVFLTIQTFLCDINGGFADDDLLCAGDSDGTLSFTLLDGVYPYNYAWEEKTGTGLTGSGVSNTPGEIVSIDNLPAGIYSVSITDNDNSFGVFIGQIFEPEPIIAEAVVSDFSGYGVPCFGSENSKVSIGTTGGSGPYTFRWEDNADDRARLNLAAGSYQISVTDNKGCEVVINAEVTEPPPIVPQLVVVDPNCIPENSGRIAIESVNGGVEPFQFSLNDDGFSTQNSFGNLVIGNYSITILDANGCELKIDTILNDPNNLTLSISGEDEIYLGDSIQLIANVNDQTVRFDWSGESISCSDCPTTFVQPFSNSTYNLIISREDNCTQEAILNIKVIDRRRVYVPSAFSPNNDGINDILQIFTGSEVTQILEFSVFGRWGEFIYQGENIEPSNTGDGWDGTFRGQNAPIGVYAWFARVEFIDGLVEVYEGDVSLFR